MLKKCGGLALALLFILILSLPAWGEEANKEPVPLDQVLKESVLLPFDFHGNVFADGGLTTYYGMDDSKNYSKDGRVLAPIRLAANVLSSDDNYWTVDWDATKPGSVNLACYPGGDKVKITAGAQTMLVNGKEVPLEAPAQMIDNQTVLPLRAIGEAVGEEIGWLDGMVIISHVPVDLSSPITKDIVVKSKNLLKTCPKDVENKLEPIAAYNGGYYALKIYDDKNGNLINELYYEKDGKSEKVNLAGRPRIYYTYPPNGKTNPTYQDGNSYYYPAQTGSGTELYRLDFATNQSTEICSLTVNSQPWDYNDGQFKGVCRFGENTYVVLHYGDLTMGYDIIYRLENGSLTAVGDAKWLSSIAEVNHKLYFTSLELMGMSENNLYCYDSVQDTEAANIALDGYAYDIAREKSKWSCSTGMEGLAVKNQYLYTMLYQESAEKDNRQVVKINTADNSQTILPIEVNKFWLVSDGIVYQDFSTGKLMKTDFGGKNSQTLVDQSLDLIRVYGDQVYYTVNGEAGLYRVDALMGKTDKLSAIVVDDILVNPAGCYFINSSYEAGIFKVSGEGAVKIADGFLFPYVNTDAGILYNKRGSADVYEAD